MNPLQTPRFSLPLLAAGQAHKELFHNEALTLLDLITDISVVDIQDDPASLTPAAGDSWLVGSSPAGGAVIDNEARTAIESILATLETFGLLRPSV